RLSRIIVFVKGRSLPSRHTEKIATRCAAKHAVWLCALSTWLGEVATILMPERFQMHDQSA
ncbi:MAG: hypothetical protein WBV91_07850, partial [Desulfobacterales bacterium]